MALVNDLPGKGYLLGDQQYDSATIYDAAADQVINWWRHRSRPAAVWDTVTKALTAYDHWHCWIRHSEEPCMVIAASSNIASLGSPRSSAA